MIFYGFVGAFKENFNEVFGGILILSILLSTIFTFFTKWIKEYKNRNKFKDKKTGATIEEKEIKGKKTNRRFVVIFTSALILMFIIASCFIVDIGINSKFFIKRDFKKAFEYRVTGDCDSFVRYLNKDATKWKERCEQEKNGYRPIRNFKIQNVSHKLGSGRAFLQVELTRNVSGKDYSRSVDYEMRKIGFIWKIDQNLR